jgi:hypothetical protein
LGFFSHRGGVVRVRKARGKSSSRAFSSTTTT